MQNWERAQDLYEMGIRADEDERRRLMAEVDPEIAAFVRKLWEQQPDARSFLADPLINPPPSAVFEKGQRIGGRFTVLQSIGKGAWARCIKLAMNCWAA